MPSSSRLVAAALLPATALAFLPASSGRPASARHFAVTPSFGDPLGLNGHRRPLQQPSSSSSLAPSLPRKPAAVATPAAFAAACWNTPAAFAAKGSFSLSELETAALDPKNFQPVCPASDGFYRFAQTLILGVVGPESYKEYAPLIAGGLLRVRLELCVVESFFYEAIAPFIKENGLSWVLPLHESVETFLAGTIFAVASNFILIGSTKIVTVIATYADIFFGFPLRLVGGAGWKVLEDKAIGEQPPEPPRPWWKGKKPRVAPPIDEVWDANKATQAGQAQVIGWGALLGLGTACKIVREGFEAADLFVGRYLLLTTVAYVGIKFVHFKLWDPIPF